MAYSVPPTEVQEAVQRLSGVFVDRLDQAFEPLINHADPRMAERSMRRHLKCVASIYEIASAPMPQVNAMDMYVFANLGVATLRRHWIPATLGDRGIAIEEAFRTTAPEIGRVLDRFLTPDERRELDDLIRDWLAQNPDQVYVEAVRLSGLSEQFGRGASDGRERRAQGLLSSVKSATQAADQALMLGERAMFLVHRMPFLIREQARLAVRQIMLDTLSTARSALEPARTAAKNARAAVTDHAGVGMAAVKRSGSGLRRLLGRRQRSAQLHH